MRIYTKRCIGPRRAHPALRGGNFTGLQAETGVYSFGRRLGEETLVVAFNVSHGSRALAVPVENCLAEGAVWKDQWGTGMARVEFGRRTGLTLAPRSALVLTEDGRA